MANRKPLADKYGMLTPLIRKGNQVKCRCDCGNTVIINVHTLRRKNHIHSCGCYQKRTLTPGDEHRCSKAGRARAEVRNIDGVNVDMLYRPGVIASNTSGTQGVSYNKQHNKWHSYINYKGKRYNLGLYIDINDAIEIRKQAVAATKENDFEDFWNNFRTDVLY